MKRPGIYQLILATTLAGFLLPNLFTTGIFGDGLIYAVISRNLSEGLGSWWNLYYSTYIFSPFAEHPPLLFWVESIWFRILGDYHFTEKSFSVLLAAGMIISLRFFWIRIARNQTEKQAWWFPVLLWILVPTIHWAYPNNMLENLMVLFTSWAVWSGFYKPSGQKALLVGVLVFLAFLTKGLVGLFPLAVFGIRWLSLREDTLRKALSWTSLALFGFVLCMAISLIPESARNYWMQYFDVQLLATLRGERLVQDHVVDLPRYYLLTRLFTELINPLLLTGLLLLGTRRFRKKGAVPALAHGYILFFALVACSATLPLLISPKQHSFYLIPAIPWFILALSKGAGPFVFDILAQWQSRQLSYKISYLFFSGLFVAALVICGWRANQPGRDADLMSAVDVIAHTTGSHQIGIPHSLIRHHSLHAYFQRNHHISLSPYDSTAGYWITEKDSIPPPGYKTMDIGISGYDLHQLSGQHR